MENTLTLLIVTVESVVANHLQPSRCSKSCNIFCIYYNHFHHLTCMPYKCLAHFIWKPTISRNDGIHPQRHEYLYYTPCVNNIIPYNHLNGETFCCAVRKIRQIAHSLLPNISNQISFSPFDFNDKSDTLLHDNKNPDIQFYMTEYSQQSRDYPLEQWIANLGLSLTAIGLLKCWVKEPNADEYGIESYILSTFTDGLVRYTHGIIMTVF